MAIMDRLAVRDTASAPASRLTALLSIALLAILFGSALPATAAAHGGKRVLRTGAGPHTVEAVVSRAGDHIDETIDLTDAATGRPVTGAIVALTLDATTVPRPAPSSP